MGRVRATGIAIGVLLFVILWQPAKADTYHATGQTDATYCSSAFPGSNITCADVAFSLDFTTSAPAGPDKAVQNFYLWISEINGEINGIAVACAALGQPGNSCGDLLAAHAGYAGPPIPDGNLAFSGTVPWLLSGGPEGVPFDMSANPHVRVGIGDTSGLTTWNIVNTPEPSALLSLGIGLLGLMGLTLGRCFTDSRESVGSLVSSSGSKAAS
jgi:hypothetical protein